jgi:CheY-like chemotaxis protein
LTSYPTTPKQLHILVVDDEAGTRTALDAVLKLAGHQALFARDGDEALGMFDKSEVPFDLIITDHAMARVSGIDLVRGLRERGFSGEIVVLTAYAGTIEEEEYRKLEVAGIMEKPFHLVDLRHWIDCIYRSRENASAGGKPPDHPGAIDFCWVKRD